MSTLTEARNYDDVVNTIKYFNIVNLVETGTGPESSGLVVAKKLGLRGFSCDVYEPCVISARERFPEAFIHHGESLGFLRMVLPTLEGPTFFWLDGHCPTDSACLPGPVFPPYDELKIIKEFKRNFAHDVFWLDDIPMIDVPDNPIASTWDVDLAGRRWYGAKEHTFTEYLDLLRDTHTSHIADSTLRFWPREAFKHAELGNLPRGDVDAAPDSTACKPSPART
jgi:hypothetical protein